MQLHTFTHTLAMLAFIPPLTFTHTQLCQPLYSLSHSLTPQLYQPLYSLSHSLTPQLCQPRPLSHSLTPQLCQPRPLSHSLTPLLPCSCSHSLYICYLALTHIHSTFATLLLLTFTYICDLALAHIHSTQYASLLPFSYALLVNLLICTLHTVSLLSLIFTQLTFVFNRSNYCSLPTIVGHRYF